MELNDKQKTLKEYDESEYPFYDTYQTGIYANAYINTGAEEFNEDLYYELCDTAKFGYDDVSYSFSYGQLPTEFLKTEYKDCIKENIVSGNFDISNIDGLDYSIDTAIKIGYKNFDITINCTGDGDVINPFLGNVDDLPFAESETYKNRYYYSLVLDDAEKSKLLDNILSGSSETSFTYRDYLLTCSSQGRAIDLLENWYCPEEAEELASDVQTVDDLYRVVDLYRKDFDRNIKIEFEIRNVTEEHVDGAIIIDEDEPIRISYFPMDDKQPILYRDYLDAYNRTLPTGFKSDEFQNMLKEEIENICKEQVPELFGDNSYEM